MDSIDTIDSISQVQDKLKRLIKEEGDDGDDIVSEAVLGVGKQDSDLLSKEDIDEQPALHPHPEESSQLEWVHQLLRSLQSVSLDSLGHLFVDCLYEYPPLSLST